MELSYGAFVHCLSKVLSRRVQVCSIKMIGLTMLATEILQRLLNETIYSGFCMLLASVVMFFHQVFTTRWTHTAKLHSALFPSVHRVLGLLQHVPSGSPPCLHSFAVKLLLPRVDSPGFVGALSQPSALCLLQALLLYLRSCCLRTVFCVGTINALC